MKLDTIVGVLMRPGVLRRGAAAFASIFSDRTQLSRIALFPRWLVGDRIVRSGQIAALCLLVMVLFRFDFTALSGIWETTPLAATCASTSVVQCRSYIHLRELMGKALNITIVSYTHLHVNILLCDMDGPREISVTHIQ